MRNLIYILLSLPWAGVAQIDSYPTSNGGSGGYSLYAGLSTASSQSFTCSESAIIDYAEFYILKQGSPTGNVYAKIYAHSGTYGTSSVPTGTALATSDPIEASGLTTSLQLIQFYFTGENKIELSGSTYYCLVIEFTGGSNGNQINGDADNISPTHSGRQAAYIFGSWFASGDVDNIFYLWAHEPENPSNIFLWHNF